VHEALVKYGGSDIGAQILDLGCGTGGHLLELQKLGYSVHGIDASPAMVEIAKAKGLSVECADLRTVHVRESLFDAVIALFHVASYQLTADDLMALFETARKSLKPGGLFIFDVWDACAVLTVPPSVRVRQASDESRILTRIAYPKSYLGEKQAPRVDVLYTLYVEDRASGHIQKLQELHCLRPWFPSQISQFQMLKFQPPIGCDYNATYVTRCAPVAREHIQR
jgi:SAM-dependent methyltransferase